MTDLEVRTALVQPPVKAIVMANRLKYLRRIFASAPAQLLAVLQAEARGQRQPWTQLILQDLRNLRDLTGNTLSELPDPEAHWQPWKDLMISYPVEWKKIISNALKCVVARDAVFVWVPAQNPEILRRTRFSNLGATCALGAAGLRKLWNSTSA